MVYVLSKIGQPLMPTNRHGKVKRLLKSGKAKVIKRCPFTIKLLYDATSYTQNIVLGVDTGSGDFGVGVYHSQTKKCLYQSEVELRNNITDKMTQRRTYRRNRRNRKTRYRKARWLNRANSIKKDRFSPTMRSKLHSHIKEIEYVCSILPVKTKVFEVGEFDCHLMKNPSLANESLKHWGYQKGPNYGFASTKAKVLCRDDHTCQHCKTRKGTMEVHHIIFRSNGGSDEEENLITLCEKCHRSLHQGKLSLNLKGKKKTVLRYATQMNSIRIQLLKHYPDAIETYGYVTKENRMRLKLPKEHCIDACVIASGGEDVIPTTTVYKKKCVSKGDFQQTKGIRSEQRITTSKICGFKKFDKVRYMGEEYFIKGRMSSGYATLMTIDGKKVDFSYMPRGCKTPKLSNCTRVTARNSQMICEVAI